ncbi:hypothetical protein LINPERHAP2_LOCUS42934 [Linum perenne]
MVPTSNSVRFRPLSPSNLSTEDASLASPRHGNETSRAYTDDVLNVGVRGEVGMTKWVRRPPGNGDPHYDSGKEDLFTIEMHFNGIFLGSEYLYGSVAWFDRVDPDYLSLIELNAMAELVNVEGDFYQFLWPKPGFGIADGLLCIECEDDVLAFNKVRKNIGPDGTVLGAPFSLMKVYVKQLSEFEARIRIGQIKMELHRPIVESRVQFTLEEMDSDREEQFVHATPGGSTSVADKKGMLLLPWTATPELNMEESELAEKGVPDSTGFVNTSSEVVPEKDNTDNIPIHEDGGPEVHPPIGAEPNQVNPPNTEVNNPEVVVNDPEVVVNDPDLVVNDNDVVVQQIDTAVDPNHQQNEGGNWDDGTRWLAVEEVLAEMERDEALNEPIVDVEEGWSSPTIYSSPETPRVSWDGRYNPFSSEEESDYAYFGPPSPPQATYSSEDESDYAYVPPEDSNESSTHSESAQDNQELDSEAGSNGELVSNARDEEDVFDRVRHEEEMLSERGWGSEEDEDPRIDRYPVFNPSRDMDAPEIVIGREFESFSQFKDFCVGHA